MEIESAYTECENISTNFLKKDDPNIKIKIDFLSVSSKKIKIKLKKTKKIKIVNENKVDGRVGEVVRVLYMKIIAYIHKVMFGVFIKFHFGCNQSNVM